MKQAADYTYDVAISLCKQDMEFAKALVSALNPSLKVFFYANNQAELISKSGPEAFARIFKDESRVVVVLSRIEWGNSFYTEIERNAIVDRYSKNNVGLHFLFMIPMVQNEIPAWYPSTRIYASPQNFNITEIAKFIEFKVTEEGGILKPITVEVQYQNFLERYADKERIVGLQYKSEAIESTKNEISLVKECFRKKRDFIVKNYKDSMGQSTITEYSNKMHVDFGSYRLECQLIVPDDCIPRIFSTQDLSIFIRLIKLIGGGKGEIICEEIRNYFYSPLLNGWATPIALDEPTTLEYGVVFHNRERTIFYDLSRPTHTDELIDLWFQKLISIWSERLEKLI